MLYTLLQISDSLFPSGAFAYSCGLEGLVAADWPDASGVSVSGGRSGRDGAAALVPLLGAIFTNHLLRCDGLFGLRAHRAMREGAIDALCEADQALLAMKIPRELREASTTIGRSFLTEVAAVLPEDPALAGWYERVERGASPGNYAVAFHAATAAAGITEHDALLAWSYQSVAQMVGALLRLGQLGHRGAQSILSRLRPVVERGVQDLLAHDPDAPSSFAPVLEIASMRHERQYSRLFRS
jgi:urease accessory protein